MPRLLILSKQADDYRHRIEAAGLPELESISTAIAAGAHDAGTDCDIVLGEPDRIREALPLLKGLHWVQSTWAGVEPLLDPDLRRDYILTNARGVFGALMAEYVFGYLLAHERRIFQRFFAQGQRRWDTAPPGTLRGKTIGLLGVGSIGAHLAATAKHFGMTVHGLTRSSEDCPHVDAYFHSDDWRDFSKTLDYLVSVLPDTAKTRHMVDGARLAELPAHAIVVNAGRGSTVHEPALVAALETGAIAGAVIDVSQKEPLPADHPFWSAPNLRLTFHTAAPSYPADIARLFVDNYRRYIRQNPLKYRVDFNRGY